MVLRVSGHKTQLSCGSNGQQWQFPGSVPGTNFEWGTVEPGPPVSGEGHRPWVCAPGSCSEFSQHSCWELLLSVCWKRESTKLHYRTLPCTFTCLRLLLLQEQQLFGCQGYRCGSDAKDRVPHPVLPQKNCTSFFLSIFQD